LAAVVLAKVGGISRDEYKQMLLKAMEEQTDEQVKVVPESQEIKEQERGFIL